MASKQRSYNLAHRRNAPEHKHVCGVKYVCVWMYDWTMRMYLSAPGDATPEPTSNEYLRRHVETE